VIVEIAQNQKAGKQIAPSRSSLKDLSLYGEVGDLTAVSGAYGKSDAHLPRFFSVSCLWFCKWRLMPVGFYARMSNAARGNEFAVAAVCGKSSATFEAFSALDSPGLTKVFLAGLAASNRGVNVEAFTDFPAAEEWLLK
jgi:hypothetical protein